MGNPGSKHEHNKKSDEPEDASVPSTPISTPKARVIDNDPRSPSTNVVRTPIQIGQTINKLNTPIIGVINTLTGESGDVTKDNVAMNVDPRSPSVEFTRTPIVTGNVPGKLRNKNLDNVKKQLTDFSPLKKSEKIENSSVEPGTPVKTVQGPILLEVTPITKKLEQAQKRKSYVGLLETNLDYVETNLDAVAKKLNSLNVTKDENITEEDEVIEKVDKLSAEMENEPHYEEIEEQKVAEAVDNKMEEEITETFVEENRESIDTELQYEEELVEEPETPDTTHESNISQSLVHKLEIISPIKETLEKISEIDKEIKEVIAHNPVVNFDETNPSRDFSQKVSNLIYEDRQSYEPVAKVTSRGKDDQRAPLSERNVNQHGRQKSSVNKLKVSDKPSVLVNKPDYSVSKIPVFKEKKSKSKVLKQCENTPPHHRQKHHSAEVKNVKKTQWDADSTLII